MAKSKYTVMLWDNARPDISVSYEVSANTLKQALFLVEKSFGDGAGVTYERRYDKDAGKYIIEGKRAPVVPEDCTLHFTII